MASLRISLPQVLSAICAITLSAQQVAKIQSKPVPTSVEPHIWILGSETRDHWKGLLPHAIVRANRCTHRAPAQDANRQDRLGVWLPESELSGHEIGTRGSALFLLAHSKFRAGFCTDLDGSQARKRLHYVRPSGGFDIHIRQPRCPANQTVDRLKRNPPILGRRVRAACLPIYPADRDRRVCILRGPPIHPTVLGGVPMERVLLNRKSKNCTSRKGGVALGDGDDSIAHLGSSDPGRDAVAKRQEGHRQCRIYSLPQCH